MANALDVFTHTHSCCTEVILKIICKLFDSDWTISIIVPKHIEKFVVISASSHFGKLATVKKTFLSVTFKLSKLSINLYTGPHCSKQRSRLSSTSFAGKQKHARV